MEPGWVHSDMVDSGRAGLAVIRAMGARWGFATDQLDALSDLFFPAAAQGPLALWYALDLRAGGVPGVKVYLNPSASGPEGAARTVREALRRLGYGQAFEQLPPGALLSVPRSGPGRLDVPSRQGLREPPAHVSR